MPTGPRIATDFLDVVADADREGCLIVGHYGGGNYGDELLLELVQRRLSGAGVERAAFVYRTPARYPCMHRDFGYRLVGPDRPLAMARTMLGARSVIVGGGGLWGCDATYNTLVLSLGIWLARHVLRKPVYLLGVGFNDTATHWGRLGARFASWGATVVVARDGQTEANFRRFTRRVRRGVDLALHIRDDDLDAYRADAVTAGAHLEVGDGAARAVFIGVRRFRGDLDRDYWRCVEQLIAEFPERRFIVATLEPPEIDTVNRAHAYSLAHRHPNVSVFDFTCNPMALLAWLRENADRLVMIAPQYHLLVSALLCGIPLYPMAYDGKVEQLLHAYGYLPVRSFYALDVDDLRTFVVKAPEPGPLVTG